MISANEIAKLKAEIAAKINILGTSQAAKLLGHSSKAMVSRLRHGKQAISWRTAFEIAEKLGIDTAMLLGIEARQH